MPDILIATFSGRPLAASARRAGYRPFVADIFADNDLRDLAAGFRTVAGDFVDGIDGGSLMRALEELAAISDPVGLVLGPGFEDRPELIEAVAARWRLLGNDAAAHRSLKDPERFAAICAANGIRHPEIRRTPPVKENGGEEWLSKRAGAAGGLHIGMPGSRDPAPDRYYQRRMPGASVSALFVAAKGEARLLGFSRQWAAPTPDQPFRFGGACGPVTLPPETAAAMARAVGVMAREAGLVGLGSADFLLEDGAEPILLEINPRPGASLDVFDHGEPPLFAMHLSACDGLLPSSGIGGLDGQVRACGYVYLEEDVARIGAAGWPDWVADRPVPGTLIRLGEPVCTLSATASSPEAAMALLAARTDEIHSQMGTIRDE
ncbi:ATP-grasp domain-containing protein [Mangrovicella endophytica]|uniref:ATP-grasp domain-containing protein n=1 Tax=Mangrovicella endophytica TaxID=2066697 RepID=UPI000C9E5C07|nr:ATP-grasp domain-containing protein [Mangrovicella endophytica]